MLAWLLDQGRLALQQTRELYGSEICALLILLAQAHGPLQWCTWGRNPELRRWLERVEGSLCAERLCTTGVDYLQVMPG